MSDETLIAVDRPQKTGRIRAKNEQLILEAAEQQFSANGYRGTTMQSIADASGLPKANVHYYFQNKANLYAAVLENIVTLWHAALSDVSVDDDPYLAISHFIRAKIEISFAHPQASKLFATEIIQGAPHLMDYLKGYVSKWFYDRITILEGWMEQGKMDRVDPLHFIFMLWSTTQHYADFNTQTLLLMKKDQYEEKDLDEITEFLCQIILKGTGIKPPSTTNNTQMMDVNSNPLSVE